MVGLNVFRLYLELRLWNVCNKCGFILGVFLIIFEMI